ncbi:MAG TPA: tetratricopeptide repeat protein, partial [Rhodocyclaceae bacterium]|nr:tetratricopeptide repeat protein [Rhodocyclaceae bacterium]
MNKSKASLIQKAEALSAAESWSEACIAWQRVVDSDQRDAQAWSNLGLSRAYAGHYPEAIDAFGIAMQRGLPPDQAALGIGIVFCLRQQYDVARENLEMAVSSNPDNIGAWSNLVVACVRLGLVQRAIQAAEKVLAVSPDNVSVLSSLGTLFKDAGIPEEAVAWCRRAAQASPDDPRVVSNTLWAMLHSDTVSPTEIVAEARQFDIRARALAVKNTPLSLARA